MSQGKKHLITTADERTWKRGESILFLGEWCRRYDRKFYWGGLNAEVANPFRFDSDSEENDTSYVRSIEATILSRLCPILNRQNKISFSKRQWMIVLGHWLRRYIVVSYNRFHTIQKCLNEHEIGSTTLFNPNIYSLKTASSYSFVQACNNPVWNNVFFGKVILYMLGSNRELSINYIDCDEVNFAPVIPRALGYGCSKTLSRKALEKISSLFMRNNEVFVVNPYLAKSDNIRLHLGFFQTPKVWTAQRPEYSDKEDQKLRQKLAIETEDIDDDRFTAFAMQLLWEALPVCYLESFREILRQLKLLNWPDKPRIIFTSNNFDTDEHFKIWTACKIANGSRYIVGQHGSNYGTLRNFSPTVEEITADRFISWGWQGNTNRHRSGFIFKQPRKGMLSYDTKGKLLSVQLASAYHIYLYDQISEFSNYFQEQQQFVGGLAREVRSGLKIRLARVSQTLHENELARWREFDPSLEVDHGNISFQQEVSRSRLVIFSYDSTGFMECLSQNIPTMAFWRGGYDHLTEDARPIYRALEAAGIVHFEGKSVAEKINLVFDDINEWWFSNQVQSARELFCDAYARLNDNPSSTLKDLFQ